MSVEQVKNESMPDILRLLVESTPDYNKLCDMIYHYNKSLGLTLVEIRKELGALENDDQGVAITNLKHVMQIFKSPNFIVDFKDSLDSEQ